MKSLKISLTIRSNQHMNTPFIPGKLTLPSWNITTAPLKRVVTQYDLHPSVAMANPTKVVQIKRRAKS